MILAMHIPDGLLSIPVGLVGWAMVAILIALALQRTRQQLSERQIPLMGVLAAFVFAAQMINFPVAGGTSGHLLGGVLIAILIGPWASVLVMTSVLTVQAFVFQDGGLLALGFNILNMGVLAAFIGYTVYTFALRLMGNMRTAQVIGLGLAAWISVEVAAIAASLELVISQTASPHLVFAAMIGIHALIGIGEALITVGALSFIRQVRPDLIRGSDATASAGSGWVVAGLVIALAITLISPLADPNPDGLERVAADQGFIDAAQPAPYTLLPDYRTPFIGDETASTIAAGITGVLIVTGVSFAVFRASRKRTLDTLENLD